MSVPPQSGTINDNLSWKIYAQTPSVMPFKCPATNDNLNPAKSWNNICPSANSPFQIGSMDKDDKGNYIWPGAPKQKYPAPLGNGTMIDMTTGSKCCMNSDGSFTGYSVYDKTSNSVKCADGQSEVNPYEVYSKHVWLNNYNNWCKANPSKPECNDQTQKSMAQNFSAFEKVLPDTLPSIMQINVKDVLNADKMTTCGAIDSDGKQTQCMFVQSGESTTDLHVLNYDASSNKYDKSYLKYADIFNADNPTQTNEDFSIGVPKIGQVPNAGAPVPKNTQQQQQVSQDVPLNNTTQVRGVVNGD
jgi:hypothetical protein